MLEKFSWSWSEVCSCFHVVYRIAVRTLIRIEPPTVVPVVEDRWTEPLNKVLAYVPRSKEMRPLTVQDGHTFDAQLCQRREGFFIGGIPSSTPSFKDVLRAVYLAPGAAHIFCALAPPPTIPSFLLRCAAF